MTNESIRFIIAIVGLVGSFYVAFRHTPELDGVKNRGFYRVSTALLWARVLPFLLFDMFGLFPVE